MRSFRVVPWLRERDPGFAALRRAGRAAVVMPTMFAIGMEVIGNLAVATFAAFGSFAMLLLVDFTGPMRERLLAQTALAVVGAGLVAAGTLASRAPGALGVAVARDGAGGDGGRGVGRLLLRRGELGGRQRHHSTAARLHPAGVP